jgi:hypothetical protein
MTFELTYYIVMMIFSYVTILYPKFFKIYVISVVYFLIIVRNAGFDTDILHFIDLIKQDFYGIFIYKEFAFWLTGRFLYHLTNSEVLTYIGLDLLWLAVLLFSFNKYKNKIFTKRLLILLFVSFPFILGIENLYRQHFALVFVMSAYLLREKEPKYSFFLYITSIFIHNSMIVFFPLMLIKHFYNFNFKARFFISNIVLFVMLTGIYLVKSGLLSEISKSAADTGLDLRFLYLSIFLIVLYFFIIKFKFAIIKFLKTFPSVYFAIITVVFMMQFHGTAPVERLAMGFLLMFTIDFFIYIESKQSINQYKKYIYLLYCMGFSVPTLVFSSVRNFLLT